MTTLYHATQTWDGNDLRSFAQQCDDGDYTLDEVLGAIADKWLGGDIRKAEEYLDEDGRYVHTFGTLAESMAYRDEWVAGGIILEIDADGLKIEIGREHDQPMVRDAIAAGRIKVLGE